MHAESSIVVGAAVNAAENEEEQSASASSGNPMEGNVDPSGSTVVVQNAPFNLDNNGFICLSSDTEKSKTNLTNDANVAVAKKPTANAPKPSPVKAAVKTPVHKTLVSRKTQRAGVPTGTNPVESPTKKNSRSTLSQAMMKKAWEVKKTRADAMAAQAEAAKVAASLQSRSSMMRNKIQFLQLIPKENPMFNQLVEMCAADMFDGYKSSGRNVLQDRGNQENMVVADNAVGKPKNDADYEDDFSDKDA